LGIPDQLDKVGKMGSKEALFAAGTQKVRWLGTLGHAERLLLEQLQESQPIGLEELARTPGVMSERAQELAERLVSLGLARSANEGYYLVQRLEQA
jgi:predicted transcriptional regulator of viral defense system